MQKTRILLVDDHAIVRLGLMALLNDQPDMEVVAEASTAAEAILAVEKSQPDVVLMDIRLPGMAVLKPRVDHGTVSKEPRRYAHSLCR